MLKSIHKNRTLMGCIYALIMLLPLSSVLFRSAYTIFNKNAYQSYYGETINEKIQNTVTGNDFVENITYTWQKNNIANGTNTGTSNKRFYIQDLYIGGVLSTANNFIINVTTTATRFFLYNNTTSVGDFFNNNANSFTFTYLYSEGVDNLNFASQLNFSYYEYNKDSYLDNAFEYSLEQFVGRNGRGVLNLTDWFVDVFLQRSQHTMLYIDFVNWYMNYTLLVSCVYLLYLVLMWFVNLARRLLTSFDVDRRV